MVTEEERYEKADGNRRADLEASYRRWELRKGLTPEAREQRLSAAETEQKNLRAKVGAPRVVGPRRRMSPGLERVRAERTCELQNEFKQTGSVAAARGLLVLAEDGSVNRRAGSSEAEMKAFENYLLGQ